MDIGTITSDGLNLRAEPNITGTVLDKLSPADKLEVYSRVSGGWLKVRVLRTGQLGYVSERFVEMEAPPSRPTAGPRRGRADDEESLLPPWEEVRPLALFIGGGLGLFAAIVVVVLLLWR